MECSNAAVQEVRKSSASVSLEGLMLSDSYLYHHLKKLVKYSPVDALCFISEQISTTQYDGAIFVTTPEPELVFYISAARHAARNLLLELQVPDCSEGSLDQVEAHQSLGSNPVQALQMASCEARDSSNPADAWFAATVCQMALGRIETFALFGGNRGAINVDAA